MILIEMNGQHEEMVQDDDQSSCTKRARDQGRLRSIATKFHYKFTEDHHNDI